MDCERSGMRLDVETSRLYVKGKRTKHHGLPYVNSHTSYRETRCGWQGFGVASAAFAMPHE
eukprot:5785985-Heterocapsa_arctica.AAC.1